MPAERMLVGLIDDLVLSVEDQGGVYAVELVARFTRRSDGPGVVLATETTERKALEEARRILELAAEAAGRRLAEIAKTGPAASVDT